MLITNGVRYGSGPMRFEGGQNAASVDRGHSMGQTPAGYRNFVHGEATNGSAAPAFGIPHGARHPATWMMGEVGGGIKSYKLGGLTIDATATGEKGLPTTASSTITINGTAAAGLIVSATGTATIAINGAAAIVATIGTTGQVAITINGNVALGAEASLTGTGTITIDGHADAMALGYMTGTTEEAGLTPAGIARAVWQALATANNDAGSMGELLNSAGAAADPLLGVVEGTLTLRDVQRLVLAVLAGEVTGAGTGTETFKGQAGEARVVSTTDASGNRTGVALDAA
jgi:hypothetical protein